MAQKIRISQPSQIYYVAYSAEEEVICVERDLRTVAERLGVSEKTVKYLLSPAHKRRCAQRGGSRTIEKVVLDDLSAIAV